MTGNVLESDPTSIQLKILSLSLSLSLNHTHPLLPMLRHNTLDGREPWSSDYGRRLMFLKVVGSNPSYVYWMNIFHAYLL